MAPPVNPTTSSAASPAKSDKREAIMQAALELFAERGFHGTAVPLVAKRAGVGAGTIYRYFASKEALVNALYQRWKRHVAEQLMNDFPAEAAPRQQFGAIFERALAMAAAHPTAMVFLELHHHAPYLNDESRLVAERVRASVRMLIDAFALQGVVKAIPSDALIALVLGAMSGLMKDVWEGHVTLTPDLAAAAQAACWDLIRR